jgi:hypothetical protein
MAEFMSRHPDATPYKVFQSKSDSGAPPPATEEAVGFMEEHKDFLQRYPQAGAWFLPQNPDDFSMAAYREQLALGLRKRKGIEEFYKDVKFAEAAPDYFATRDARDAALANAKGDRERTATINKQWSDFSKSYLASHPVFEEQLLSPDGELRRKHALAQLHDALADPDLPDTPANGAIADLVATYDALQQYLAPLQGLRDRRSTDARHAATGKFIDWAHGYIVEHPEVEGLYNSVFRLTVGDK